MDNQIDIAATRLAIAFSDEAEIPARFKNKNERFKKNNTDSSLEVRFLKNVIHWKNLISIMLIKIDVQLAWRCINLSPRLDNPSDTLSSQQDFCDIIDYLELRRDKENCDSEELGRLAMLSYAFQKEMEKKLNPRS